MQSSAASQELSLHSVFHHQPMGGLRDLLWFTELQGAALGLPHGLALKEPKQPAPTMCSLDMSFTSPLL